MCTAEYLVATTDHYTHAAQSSGVRGEDFAPMPLPVTASNRDGFSGFSGLGIGLGGDSGGAAGWTSGNAMTDFVREKDFQMLLPLSSDLDLNDPRNAVVLGAKARAPKIMDR